jgi:hypothetical protein
MTAVVVSTIRLGVTHPSHGGSERNNIFILIYFLFFLFYSPSRVVIAVASLLLLVCNRRLPASVLMCIYLYIYIRGYSGGGWTGGSYTVTATTTMTTMMLLLHPLFRPSVRGYRPARLRRDYYCPLSWFLSTTVAPRPSKRRRSTTVKSWPNETLIFGVKLFYVVYNHPDYPINEIEK